MELFRIILYLITRWQFIFVTALSIILVWIITSLTSMEKRKGPKKKKIKLIQKKKKEKQKKEDETEESESELPDNEEREFADE